MSEYLLSWLLGLWWTKVVVLLIFITWSVLRFKKLIVEFYYRNTSDSLKCQFMVRYCWLSKNASRSIMTKNNKKFEFQVSTTMLLLNMPLITSIFFFHTLLNNNEHEPTAQTYLNPSSFKMFTLFSCHDCHQLLQT